MIINIVLQIIAGIVGIWLASHYVEGVQFTGPLKTFLVAGVILGLINSILKPIVSLITLPLKILTLGIFALVVNMAMVWIVDLLIPELDIKGIIPLFWATIVIWALSMILRLFSKGKV